MLLFEAIVGSQAYGTAIETSDVDIKSIYLAPISTVLTNSFKPQIDVNKDEVKYEVSRFLHLAGTANPTMLELLFMPESCVRAKDEYRIWDDLIFPMRYHFLTKQCNQSFGGYAIQQIKKARGLDKKMNWEKERITRKGVNDFCYVGVKGKSISLNAFMKQEGLLEQNIGLVKLDHMADCYAMYYDDVKHYMETAKHITIPRGEQFTTLNYKGVSSANGNSLLLSNVPKYAIPLEGVLYFNKSEYASHCKEYREYQEWLEKRNTQRYIDSKTHGQKIDGKNLMHCVRLLDTAYEIATQGELIVKRTNAEELLKIRRGEVDLEELLQQSEKKVKLVDEAFADSNLPNEVDPALVKHILYTIRRLQLEIEHG